VGVPPSMGSWNQNVARRDGQAITTGVFPQTQPAHGWLCSYWPQEKALRLPRCAYDDYLRPSGILHTKLPFAGGLIE
jgi:hypothetical protein